MREVFDVPEDDRFMTIDEYDKSNFLYSENYLGIARDDDFVIVQITVNNTRGPEEGALRADRGATGKESRHQAGKHFCKPFGSPKGELVVWQRHRAICVSDAATAFCSRSSGYSAAYWRKSSGKGMSAIMKFAKSGVGLKIG
jgi:hypothetical protein